MCELNGNYWDARRPVDIAKCHCFYELRERKSVTVRDYISELQAIGMGHHSIIRSLLDGFTVYNCTIVAWSQDGLPIPQGLADLISFSKAEQFREKCLELWNDAADEDQAEYSPIEYMVECHVCGKPYQNFTTNGSSCSYMHHKKPAWSHLPNLKNRTQFNSCMRKKCRAVAKAAFATGLRKDYRSKSPYTLYLLQEAVKHGGNNTIFRWLKKNAFRDVGKVCQR